MTHATPPNIAAIDVGTNAVRLQIGQPRPDGTLDLILQEREPVRPGEGLFTTGSIARPVVDRILTALRRYAQLCRRHHATVRAVATSALREASNRDDIVRRIHRETGIQLDVISGKEEARLICLGVLHGARPTARSICIDIGGGSTEIAAAEGEHPANLWSVALGGVRLTELFDLAEVKDPRKIKLAREYAAEVLSETLPPGIVGFPPVALGSSGSVRTLISFSAPPGTQSASPKQISRALEVLVRMGPLKRRLRFEARRADIIVAAAIILEALANRLKLKSVISVTRGLRDGILVDLMQGTARQLADTSLTDAILAFGRRFQFDEQHARQVARLALTLFDGMAAIHRLPASTRPYLETASLLHDVGNAISYQKHHRHSEYMVRNADLPGLTERELDLVARVARYHRRSPPDVNHAGMAGLAPSDARLVRKLATLLRVADALDRSHAQAVAGLRVVVRSGEIVLRLTKTGLVDLELWDLAHEAALFRKVFGVALRPEAHAKR